MIFTFKRWSEADAYLRHRWALFICPAPEDAISQNRWSESLVIFCISTYQPLLNNEKVLATVQLFLRKWV